MGAEAPKEPNVMFRSFPGGMVMPIKATALGIIKAPPMPEKALAMLNAV